MKKIKAKNTYPFAPVRTKENIGAKEVALIEAHRLDLPGVMVEAVARRSIVMGIWQRTRLSERDYPRASLITL